MPNFDIFMQSEDEVRGMFTNKQLEDLSMALRDFEYVLIHARKWGMKRGWQIKARKVDDSFFFIPTRGSFVARVGGASRLVSPGELMIVPDGAEHSVRASGNSLLFEAITLHALINNAWQQPFLSMVSRRFLKLPDHKFWIKNLLLLVSAFNSSCKAERLIGEAILKNIIVNLFSCGMEIDVKLKPMDPRVARSVQYINENYMHDITVTDLAQDCKISSAQFRKIFHKTTKTTPKDYLINLRLKMAAKLLLTSTMRINEVGFNVGFNEEHYFYFKFKEKFGCTPTEYRDHGPDKKR